MTDLTAVLFPTATPASSLAPAAPASVTGVPGMAGQFAQTLGDLLGETASVAASPGGVVPPEATLPLAVRAATGPLQPGKLLATGMPDRQTLADDGNAVPADPAIQLLANPGWRANLVTPLVQPRTSVPLRTALERAAAQLATPVAAKAARGSITAPAADASGESAEEVSTSPEAATGDPIAAPATPDSLVGAPPIFPAALPIATPKAEHAIDSGEAHAPSEPILSTTANRHPGNIARIAARTTAAVPTSAEDAASLSPQATPRTAPSDQAVLTALGALPGPQRDVGRVQAATLSITPTLPQSAPQVLPISNSAAVRTAIQPPAATFALQQPATPTLVPAATATFSRADATLSPPSTKPDIGAASDSSAPRETLPVRLDRNVVPQIAVSNAPQPAGQVFAAAIATAATWRDRPAAERTDPAAATPPPGLAAAIGLGGATPVQSTGDAQRAPLDLTQDTGVQRMIDHIEVLRDDADSRDTRIRLVPDALGSVDVAVRQVGERIHVSFTAEHEATRALIADAQPRLTELAAERGVRIAGTSVATDANPGASQSPAQGQGQTQSQSQPQSQSRPNAPQQPPRAPARAQRDSETPEDQRLA